VDKNAVESGFVAFAMLTALLVVAGGARSDIIPLMRMMLLGDVY